MNWLTTKDVSINQRLEDGPYKGATIQSISRNGWCQLTWDDGRKFSARVHWLTAK